MRRNNIVFGILLILPIIHFALAAPVLLEELEGNYGEVEREVYAHFKSWGTPAASESSYAHASSSSALPGPDHGLTIVVRPSTPRPNPASSTANPDPSVDRHGFNAMSDDDWSYKGDDESHWQYSSTSSGYDSDREFMEAHKLQPNHPLPSTDSDSSTNPDLDWNYLTNAEDLPPRPTSPKEFGQTYKYQADDGNQPSTSGYAPSPPEPGHEVVTNPPSPNQGSSKDPQDGVSPPSLDPELYLDHQPLSANSQPVDPQAALYAAKGKAKVSRRISGTARDVGNAAQRELQPVKRRLIRGSEFLSRPSLFCQPS
jgi:hypothetical protein